MAVSWVERVERVERVIQNRPYESGLKRLVQSWRFHPLRSGSDRCLYYTIALLVSYQRGQKPGARLTGKACWP